MASLTNGTTILPNSFAGFIAGPNFNHVTVVQVDEGLQKNRFDDDFVTVLKVGDENDKAVEEDVVIYRLPGERLGMALKFDGGINAEEKINKVFIQSINIDSPASKAKGQHLDVLKEGDQIMQIDGRATTSMTRLECIGLLRDAPVCIKMRVRRDIACQTSRSSNHSPLSPHESHNQTANTSANQSETANHGLSKVNSWPKKMSKVPPPVPKRSQTTTLSSKRKTAYNYQTRSDSESEHIEKPPRKKLSQPPPLPPRRPKVPPPKPPNVKSAKEEEEPVDIEQRHRPLNEHTVDDMEVDANDLSVEEVIETKVGQNEKQMDSENKLSEPTLPSEPDVYLDLLADEDRLLIESESDDTGSSVSTIIERFSRTSTANSSFSDHINQKDIVGRVLSPFEKLERELDQKEALQAFVNKAAAVLMADEDLRQITAESLGTDCKADAEECADTSSLQLSDQSSLNSLDNEGLPNVQIIVPPEEFANSVDKVDEQTQNQELYTNREQEDCFTEVESMELLMNESDSFDNEIKFIDSIINEVERDHNSQQRAVSETLITEFEEEIQVVDQSEIMVKNDTSAQMEVVTTDTQSSSSLQESTNDLIAEVTNDKTIFTEDETSKDIEVIENIENKKTIEDKVDSVVNTSETNDLLKNSLNSNDNTIDNGFDFYNEKDLFGDIDELNREIEALEELVEYEIKMESLKASNNKNSQETSDKQEHQTNDGHTKSRKQKESSNPSDKSKKCVEKENENSQLSVQLENGNKYSPPMSLIPRRLPSAAPRKSKSFCNLTALQYLSCNSPDKRPSLIPRPVSTSKTNLTIIGTASVKSESPKQNHRTESHFTKVQNAKTGHKSKTRILSERKKYEVMNYSNESKRTVHQQKSGRSGLKCKSLMDLTAAFNSAEVRNGVNDSEEPIECVQNSGQKRDQCLVLIETNRTESSLQCRETEQTIGGTESESRIDSPQEDNQKHIITDTCLNRETPNKEQTVVNTSNDSSDDKADEVNQSSLTETNEETPTSTPTQTTTEAEAVTVTDTETETTSGQLCVPNPTEDICKEVPTEEEKTKEDIKLINDIEPEVEAKEDKEDKEEVEGKVIQEVTQQVEQSTDESLVKSDKAKAEETPQLSEVNETETITETEVEVEEKEEEKEEQLSEDDMLRPRRTRELMALSCTPPTYARQPPDGREITMSYMDGQSSKGVNPPLSYNLFQTPTHGREDSGVFIDTDTPSPELDYNNSLTRNGLSNASVTRIKYKPNLNGDNSSDGDTGVTSLSSDSMDELDSCSLPVSNYRLSKQIIEKSRIPSSDFLTETAPNGLELNGSPVPDPRSSRESSERSVREKIAMFDTNTDNRDELKSGTKSLGSVKTDVSYDTLLTPNARNEENSERTSSNDNLDQIGNKLNNEPQNGSVYSAKSLFIHKKSSSLISETPQSSVPQYSGHLQPSYLRYSSLGSQNDSSQNNQFSGIGVHRPITNGNLLSSILETRKQNASKLKGLVIPDVAPLPQPAVSKPLPTILSSTSTSSLLLTPKPEEMVSLSQKSQVQCQPNLLNSYNSPILPSQRPPTLPEPTSLPSWSVNSANIPKYSPAFKRRQLELPRSLSLLNNALPERTDVTDSSMPNFNRSNSMTQMNANDSQFQFSLSHSKPVIAPLPETADGMTCAKSTPSLDEQLALIVNDPYRHSSVQRRYSADVFNYNNSLKFSLEKRSSADSTNNLYKTPMTQISQPNDFNGHPSDRSPVLNNKFYHSMSYLENKGRPSLSDRTNTKMSDIDHSLQRNIFSYNSKPIHPNLNLNHKSENGFNRSMNKTFARSLIHSDYSDDDSSTISHKTSEDSSVRDDSDTTSDSMDQSISPELSRPKVLGTQLTVLRNPIESEKISINTSDSVKNFRALAEQWEQRSGFEGSVATKSIPPPLPPKPNSTAPRMPPSLMPRNKAIPTNDSSNYPVSAEPKPIEPIFCAKTEIKNLENTLKQLELEEEREASKTSLGPNSRSDSLSSSSSEQSVKSCNGHEGVGSRSRSVSDICKVFELSGSESPPQNRSSRSPSINSIKTITNDVKSMADVEEEDKKEEILVDKENIEELESIPFQNNSNNISNYSEEKSDIWDKTISKEEPVLTHHQRMSSIDSLASDSLASDSGASSSGVAVRSLGLRTSSASNLRDSQYGSVSSLASSTSLISPQELQQLIEEANQSLEANDINSHNIQVVVLHREYKTSGSIGITLAGGSDCETKEITVHRVINGSITDRDGRIKKGDRILSINGKILKGVTHKEALDIMKAPRPEVVIVLSRMNAINTENGFHSRQSSSDLNDSSINGSNLHHNSNEDILSSMNKESDIGSDSGYKILRAELQKDVTGLGFILEGGKDSPLGDRPLLIKRIFRGGAADKEGTLVSGDEVLTVNEHSVSNMTRTEAWNFLKKIPEGPVILVVKRKKY